MKSQINVLICVSAAMFFSAAPLYPQTFTFTPITAPVGTDAVFGQNLNNLGQVVGYTTIRVGSGKQTTSVHGPAFWWINGSAVVLPPVAGKQYAEAHALSDTGVAVGVSFDVINGVMTDYHATQWVLNTDGTFTANDLNAVLPAGPYLEPQAISEDGRFIGVEGTSLGPVLAEFGA